MIFVIKLKRGGIMRISKILSMLFLFISLLICSNKAIADGAIYPADNGKYYYELSSYKYTDYSKYPYGYNDTYFYQRGWRQSAKVNVIIPIPKSETDFIKYKNENIVCLIAEVQLDDRIVDVERPGKYGLPEKVSTMKIIPTIYHKGFVTGEWVEQGNQVVLTNSKIRHKKNSDTVNALSKYMNEFGMMLNDSDNFQSLVDDMLKKFAYAYGNANTFPISASSQPGYRPNMILKFPNAINSLDGIKEQR